MELDFKGNRGFRLMYISECLRHNEVVKKSEFAKKLCVSPKSIQRDIEDVSLFFENYSYDGELIVKYSRTKGGYFLMKIGEWIPAEEVIKICKNALNEGKLEKKEIEFLINRIAAPEERTEIRKIII